MATGKGTSVYLTNRAIEMIRFGDTKSGRISQVLDRYAEMVHTDGPQVRAEFDLADWKLLREAMARAVEIDRNTPALSLFVFFTRYVRGVSLVERLKKMPAGDFFILVELLEAEHALEASQHAATPATHS